VQIWNGEVGTVDFVLDHHSADVLCLAAAEVSIINIAIAICIFIIYCYY
jgi:hypothetical protein